MDMYILIDQDIYRRYPCLIGVRWVKKDDKHFVPYDICEKTRQYFLRHGFDWILNKGIDWDIIQISRVE